MTVDEARALLIAYTRPYRLQDATGDRHIDQLIAAATMEALEEMARARIAPRAGVHPCPRCRGYGDVRKGGPRGTVRGLEVCGKCEGTGWLPSEGA